MPISEETLVPRPAAARRIHRGFFRSALAGITALTLLSATPAVADEIAEEVTPIPEILTELEDHEAEGDFPVTTHGVVTAIYPDEGSFGGFYIQTEGTGGEDFELGAHEVSEAIFVYSPWSVDDAVDVGDYVEVTGDATIYDANDQKQISLFPGSDQTPHHELLVIDDEDFDPVTPAEIEFPETPGERDALLGMLIEPQGGYTVTDHYTLNQFGEIGIVSGHQPLRNPTSVVAPGEEAQALAEQNSNRVVYLDDGSTTNFNQDPGNQLELPYITAENPVRVGAPVNFQQPVIVHYDFGEYRFQPTTALNGPEDENTPASFGNTRENRQTPAAPSADLRIAGFNVLNYFVHLGEDEPGCDYYTDRDGNPTTADWCEVRGAWSQESFQRQEDKIVAAINAMDADMVALQEVENSAHFHPEGDRDYAHARLVEALNADLGYQAWDYVASPDDVPEDEDVIRNGYIYKPEILEVTDSWILFDEGIEDLDPAHFADLDRDLSDIYSNAREPFAVQFQPVDGDEDDQFIAIVNHFKSKSAGDAEGANADQGDGQSAWNADRIYQAEGLQAFADALVEHTGTQNVHLMGDFNSYEMEDPLQVFFNQGYTNLSAETGQYSYMFNGEVGSLDHLISSESAADTVNYTEIWPINAAESIGLEYSRYNGNASQLYQPDPWRSSDHDPIVADIVLAGTGEEPPPTESPDPSESPSESQTPTEDPSETPAPSETPTETPTEGEDESSTEPTPSPTADDTADPTQDAGATEAEDDTRNLARTGATVGGIVMGALLLVGLGSLLLAYGRREVELFD